MLDVINSVESLTTTVTRHFLHIKNQHAFIRAWAVQFELAYTDFRVIQMALQLAGPDHHDLLVRFTHAYEAVYAYEYSFAAGGLEGFAQDHGTDVTDYEARVATLTEILSEIHEEQQRLTGASHGQ